jgi:hypothetical protein
MNYKLSDAQKDFYDKNGYLNLVEDILGPNFYAWASSFFIKEPHSTSTVGWRQEAYYWPRARITA